MSQILRNATIGFAGIDLTGVSNSVAAATGREQRDDTVFGHAARTNKSGLLTTGLAMEGFWDAEPDEALFAEMDAGAVLPAIVGPDGLDPGALAYLYQLTSAEYTPPPSGAVGDLAAFSFSAESGGRVVRGRSLYFATTSSGITSTPVQVGQVGANERLFAALLVFGGTGTFEVKVRSAGNEAFDSSPTDRVTFGEVATGVSRAAEWATPVAGPITQSWWRIETTGTLTARKIAVAIGIL